MEHNPISSGDLAQTTADRNKGDLLWLNDRVTELEEQVEEFISWSQKVVTALNDLDSRSPKD